MPLPKPRKDEDHDGFMGRCMGDEVMSDEYPDDDQRYAVCQSLWDDSRGKTMANDKQVERRYLPLGEMRLTKNDDGLPTIHGYAAVFDKLSDPIMGMFRERIAPGAFKRTLKERADVRALVNHDAARIIGRSKARTLDLAEDDKGLKVAITPPDTTTGRDVVESIRRGDLDGMSFGFITVKDAWEYGKDGAEDVRTLLDVDLFDVSVVTFPAYPDTSVGVRKEDLAVALRSREEWRKVAGAAAEAAAEAEPEAEAEAQAEPEPDVAGPAPKPARRAPVARDLQQSQLADEQMRKINARAVGLGILQVH